MNILIIPDSFKDCLPAAKVGEYIKQGFKVAFPESNTKVIPIADGGEGTVRSIVTALGGKIIKTKVHDPLGHIVASFLGVLPDKKTAVIEMAAASGIELIALEERNPMKSSTFGTGELIKKAIDIGCTEIIIGIGGSATNDGGMGMAVSLGVKFIDQNNEELKPEGRNLSSINSIDFKNFDHRIKHTKITIASDVTNPLCGENGATKVFGKQKGATTEMLDTLEKGLLHFGNKINEIYSEDIFNIKGGGAAGGLGAGLVAFTGAVLKPGFSVIAELLNIEHEIKNSDIIITAEGRIDFQTLFGKAPAAIGNIAKKYNKPFFIFAGAATEDASTFDKNMINAIIPISRRPVSLEEAIQFAPEWLKQAATELGFTLKTGLYLT